MVRGKKSSSALLDFLIRTATDPDDLARFLEDPEAAVRSARLSAADRQIVLSRKASVISAALRSRSGDLRPESAFAWIITPDLGDGPGIRGNR